MMQRRDALRVIATSAVAALAPAPSQAASSKVRVTLVRWPYT
jgi:hypothetical protein